ncbi:MAG: hypothetical protein A2015_16550 [Spirochaetes bacterium GWF1_31_7]|nr:MAG: hypothetical protein A2Y30_13915 [Spirochaetes bacterium GWE1_32_154]OHD50055.1 MAG: hypothetical protein A2Y29_11960 [Spirochaetes bacterium GWE2_31_10]OHD52369.1 MAG: hypothetical protein A2015_16550 [Spirochaetes bacterium GWF1_31_7]HBD96009.1 hypothetical protein [Spirochaetia bacterium]HBI38521.1 hypothetical protein [Spirochaetia bacterium]
MNSKERVFSVITGKEPDRPPVVFTLSLYGSKLINVPPEIYYTNYNEYVRGQAAVINQIEPDILLAPFALSYEGAAFGSEITYLNHGVPNIKKPAFKNISDMLNIKIPDIDTDKHILYIRNSVKLLKQEFGDSFPIAAIVTSPIDLPILLLGLDLWLETILFNKDAAKIISDITAEFCIRYANALIDGGADLIVMPGEFWNPRIVSKDIAIQYALPLFIRTFPQIKAPIVLHSGGNPISPIDLYVQVPNVIAFLLSKMDSFADARKIAGKERLLMGNMEGTHLFNLNEQTIEKICYKILEDTKNDTNFIFATAGADIQYDTDINKIILVKKIMSQRR